MSEASVEQRLEQLERIVEEMRRDMLRRPGLDDWRTTIGAFADDPVAEEIIIESLRLREEERRQFGS